MGRAQRAEEAAKPATSARVARGRMRTLAQSVDDYKHTYNNNNNIFLMTKEAREALVSTCTCYKSIVYEICNCIVNNLVR